MDRKTVEIIKQALAEDAVDQDVTSLNLINKEQILSGSFIVKSTGVVSGIDVVKEVYRQINPKIKLDILRDNGTFVNRGDVIASIEGPMRDILRGERVALNFLQRMSGIAAITAKYLQEIVGTNAQIMDTRNTTPLLRGLERQAVNDAKGLNEHLNLSDQVVITANHVATLGGIKKACAEAKKIVGRSMKIEVEVESLDEYLEAANTSCDIITLLNMTNEQIKEIVDLNNKKKKIKVSGNIELKKIRSIAILGVDYIAVSLLTHSYKALDIHLRVYKKLYK